MTDLGRDDTAPLPSDFASLRDRIVAEHDRLPRRLAQVAAFALAEPDEIAFGTAATVAAAAGVQPSALVRFAQALGFRGFTEFQALFRERLRDRLPNYEARMAALSARADPVAPVSALLDGFSDAAFQSLRALRESDAPAQIQAVVARLATARTIYLVGFRRAYPIAAYLAYALGKLDVRYALCGSAGGIEAEPLAFAERDDVVLAISFSPYAPATLALLGDLSVRDVPVVAITDGPFSPLAQSAAAWIEVAEADFEGFRSLSATFALAMTLAVGVAQVRRSRSAPA